LLKILFFPPRFPKGEFQHYHHRPTDNHQKGVVPHTFPDQPGANQRPPFGHGRAFATFCFGASAVGGGHKPPHLIAGANPRDAPFVAFPPSSFFANLNSTEPTVLSFLPFGGQLLPFGVPIEISPARMVLVLWGKNLPAGILWPFFLRSEPGRCFPPPRLQAHLFKQIWEGPLKIS